VNKYCTASFQKLDDLPRYSPTSLGFDHCPGVQAQSVHQKGRDRCEAFELRMRAAREATKMKQHTSTLHDTSLPIVFVACHDVANVAASAVIHIAEDVRKPVVLS
jgi:hypothetical protein